MCARTVLFALFAASANQQGVLDENDGMAWLIRYPIAVQRADKTTCKNSIDDRSALEGYDDTNMDGLVRSTPCLGTAL